MALNKSNTNLYYNSIKIRITCSHRQTETRVAKFQVSHNALQNKDGSSHETVTRLITSFIMLKNLRKVIQKRVYDVLSHKYGIFMVIAAAVILIVAALHFGEVRMCLFLIFLGGGGVIFT